MWAHALLFYQQPYHVISHDFTSAVFMMLPMRMGLGIVYNLEFSFPFLLSQLFSLLFMAFHLSMFQASSARAIRLLKGTTGCWTRFRLYGGSARTSASSEEIPTALPYLDLGSELPASVCSPSPITLKVGHH